MTNSESEDVIEPTVVEEDHLEIASTIRVAKFSARPFPPFMRSFPGLWFYQIEAIFSVSDVTDDRDKYENIICQLELDVLSYVEEIFDLPPEEQTYTLLKKRLIAVFSDLETKRLQNYIKDISLDSKKPSELLRAMRIFAANRFTETILRTLWMQKLPTQMQAILQVSNMSLTELSLQADTIHEVMMDILAKEKSDQIQQDLFKSIRGVFKQLKQLTNIIRSESRMRPAGRLCYFHNKFGANATRCKKNCSFKSPLKNRSNAE